MLCLGVTQENGIKIVYETAKIIRKILIIHYLPPMVM